MEIFYIKINEQVVKKYNRIKLKQLQSKLGRYIVEHVGKNIYHINDTEIVTVENKPKFKYSEIEFSISHSKNIVLVAFDKFPVGVDIEFMKDRDFANIAGHYGITATDKETFYKQWTRLEAEIKLQATKVSSYTKKFENEYMLAIASTNLGEIMPTITELNYHFSVFVN